MQIFDDTPPANLWVRALSNADRALLIPHFTRVSIERETVLVAPNRPIDAIFFPESGIASIVAAMHDSGQTEVGIFGREGMSGVFALLGAETTLQRTFMQVGGASALTIPIETFRSALDQSGTLKKALLRYVQTVMTQLSYSVVSNARHPLEARLARWLLMCHDRIDGDELNLTHEFMAMMIGAQRRGVTVTLHILEGGGSIRSKRGRVVILDRERLEELAGSAYGAPEAEYRTLIGDFGRDPQPEDLVPA